MPAPDSKEFDNDPAVADVDGDGRAEIFVAGHDRMLRSLRIPRAKTTTTASAPSQP